MALSDFNNQVTTDDDIIDISLAEVRKKKFRIDGDNNRILELNTSDMSVPVRLKETYPKLMDLVKKISETKQLESHTDEGDELEILANEIEDADNKLKEYLDRIFDAPVSKVCVPNGTLYDLFNGKFRFEIIIEKIAALYNTNISNEIQAVNKRMATHTSKYIG